MLRTAGGEWSVMGRSPEDFFDRESSRYRKFVEGRDFDASLKDAVRPLLEGTVLEIGSGCISDFQEGKYRRYVALDLSLKMLRKLEAAERVEAVCGDAHALPFGTEAFDLIICRSVLHHLNPDGRDVDEMEGRLENVFREARRISKPEAGLVVIEPCLSPFLEAVERFLAPLVRRLMRALGLPYVFLFSAATWTRLLDRAGWSLARKVAVRGTEKRSGWIAPIWGLPWFKIPRGLSPSRVHLIEGRKG
jgi:SAM-dependent methyltransferase